MEYKEKAQYTSFIKHCLSNFHIVFPAFFFLIFKFEMISKVFLLFNASVRVFVWVCMYMCVHDLHVSSFCHLTGLQVARPVYSYARSTLQYGQGLLDDGLGLQCSFSDQPRPAERRREGQYELFDHACSTSAFPMRMTKLPVYLQMFSCAFLLIVLTAVLSPF